MRRAIFIGVGGSTTRVSSGSSSSGDEGARYLFNSDVDPSTAGVQNVITYTIGTYQPPATGQISTMITTMKSMAKQGGGSYYDATSIQKLSDAFGSIFTEIQGSQHRICLGLAAGQCQYAGHVPEPGVHRNVPD
jgi:hypothetical protein